MFSYSSRFCFRNYLVRLKSNMELIRRNVVDVFLFLCSSPDQKLKNVNKHVGPISDLKMSAGKIRRSHNTEWCNKPLHKCTYYRVFLSAEPTRYQIQKQNFDLSPKGFNRISAVQSTFLLLQSSDCTSSCTWLQTRKKPKEQKYAGYGWE